MTMSGISNAQPAEPQSGRLSAARGLERLALIPFKAPMVTVLAALALAALAIVGIQRIRVDDSLSQMFRSNDVAFKQYEEVSRDYPSSEYDVLIVVSGDSLLARESVDKLRDFVTDVQLIEGTRGALSMFSARLPAPQGGMPEPLFPDSLPQGAGYHELIDRVKANEIVRGKLLSDDGRLSVVILSLEPSVVNGGKLDAVMNDIRRTADEDMQGSGLVAELTGVPVMQLEIRHALEHDRVLYNAIGFALGCAIAGYFFRRLSLMIVAAAPPLLAIVFALGALGWLGFRLNMFLNVMTPLIMVISFSDSMQLTFAARDQLIAGKDKRTAFRNSILIVGPACILTHAAAGLSLLGLLTSSSDVIRGFGIAGFLATAVALVTVLSLVPTLGVLLVRDESRLVATLRNADSGVVVLRRFCDWIARRMISRPILFTLLDLVVVVGLAIFYSGLKPSYRLADQVPDREQAVAASGRLDAEISGSNPIQVMITFPPGLGLYAPQTLATMRMSKASWRASPG
jgi:predicted RND superfamily exporter protein